MGHRYLLRRLELEHKEVRELARVLDITDKLTFDGNPKLKINGAELEVNEDAPTVLKIMGLMGGDPGTEEVLKAYELIFPESSRKEMETMKLNFQGLMTVIQEAIKLVTGEADTEKEQ